MTEENKGGTCAVTKTLLKVVIGIALLAIGARLVWLWRFDVLVLIRGFLGAAVILGGIIFLAIAKE